MTRRAHSPSASHPARRPPLPCVPPEPRSAVIRTQTASAVPTPSIFGGCPRLLSQPLPTAHPRQALWPRLQSRFSSGLYFLLPLQPQLFIAALERGSRAPCLASPITERGEDGYLGALGLLSPTSCDFQTHPSQLHTLGFKLFASCLSGVGAAEKVICQDNRMRIHFPGWLLLLFYEDEHRIQLSHSSVHTPCNPKSRAHRMHSRTQHFPKNAPAATQGTRPPGLTPQTSPHWATNICQPRRRVTVHEETPCSTPTSPRSAQARNSHALHVFNAPNFPHGLYKRYPQCWVPYPSETKDRRTH